MTRGRPRTVYLVCTVVLCAGQFVSPGNERHKIGEHVHVRERASNVAHQNLTKSVRFTTDLGHTAPHGAYPHSFAHCKYSIE
ncbi:hypothetical protein PLICRDRAFT_49118 [Plicaturopsis crispa FD-325 SS-3]|nr:hypothetical protein PLICRDRAFT_49118 [Plicaturopsis crispa FD-325 SS-3]